MHSHTSHCIGFDIKMLTIRIRLECALAREPACIFNSEPYRAPKCALKTHENYIPIHTAMAVLSNFLSHLM